MKTNRLIIFGKAVAIAIVLLGVIHNIATFTPLVQGGLTCLSKESFGAMIFMSLVCGTSFILSGVVLIILLSKVQQFGFLNTIILVIGFFLIVSGVLSVVYMVKNPFAWVGFVVNLLMFIISISLKIKLFKN